MTFGHKIKIFTHNIEITEYQKVGTASALQNKYVSSDYNQSALAKED